MASKSELLRLRVPADVVASLRMRAREQPINDYVRSLLIDHLSEEVIKEDPNGSSPLDSDELLREEGTVILHLNAKHMKTVESTASYRFLQRRNGTTSPSVDEYLASLVNKDIAEARREILTRRRL